MNDCGFIGAPLVLMITAILIISAIFYYERPWKHRGG